jgi:hypothetical protein
MKTLGGMGAGAGRMESLRGIHPDDTSRPGAVKGGNVADGSGRAAILPDPPSVLVE